MFKHEPDAESSGNEELSEVSDCSYSSGDDVPDDITKIILDFETNIT